MLWGSGLGRMPGDEAAGPIPGDIGSRAPQVLVGVQPAKVLYAGRSGCCAGIDQILIEVPKGVEGCNVPVHVRFPEDGFVSLPASVSIASGTGACSDPDGLTESEARATVDGKLRGARILAGEYAGSAGWLLAFGPVGQPGLTSMIPAGTCGFTGLNPGFAIAAPQDAGATMRIHTPTTLVDLYRYLDYTQEIDGSYISVKPEPLEPGTHSVENGSGGSEIGPLRFSF